VSSACFYEPVVNPTYQDFATHYGTAILLTRVAARQSQSRDDNADR